MTRPRTTSASSARRSPKSLFRSTGQWPARQQCHRYDYYINATLPVDEGARTPLFELWVEFTLTPQQMEREGDLMMVVTLATRAANLLSQAEDVVIFQGQPATDKKAAHPLFTGGKVQSKSGPAGEGLLNVAKGIVNVPYSGAKGKYGENTFAAVASAYTSLQSGIGLNQAHYGPYTLVLHTVPYADTYAPLKSTLIMPADRIKPLMTAGFYGTGTLPELTSILVSIGGDTMDLVIGRMQLLHTCRRMLKGDSVSGYSNALHCGLKTIVLLLKWSLHNLSISFNFLMDRAYRLCQMNFA